ncbi:hypothetical protein CK203_080464 [Vitis vinifera]|uniref:Endonuclease/exonuclease/phosphatase domain-containing protein n=1 Tax=Vitis vinifera TaxID=29760 RepID=A0A438E7I8_VITVI|nr:hypothetical protein CK203_080464 [Vitis vinifera]
MRRKRRNEAGRHSSEVRGEETSRAGQRVKKEWVSVRLETLQPSDEGTDVQGAGSGQVEVSPDLSPTTRTWALTGKLHSSSPIAGPKETRRVGGPSLMSGSMDLKMKGVAASDFGLDAGPSNRMEDVGCYAKGPASTTARSANEGPNCSKGCSQQPDPGGKLREGPKSLAAQEETGFLLKCLASSYPPEPEPFVARESEDTRKFQGVVRLTETNRALEEESMRYGMGSGSWGKRALGILISILFFSIGLRVYEACNERINGRKELGVTKSSSDKGRRNGRERHGTGQRAPNCDCPMKVKILSWNVRGANDSSKRKVIKTFIRNQRVDLICIQETKMQLMTDSIARSLGSGRFLDWKAVNAEGASGGIFICWDRRSLDILDWEEG